MIAYLIKAILCSGVFITFYLLFLQEEKIHRFNRIYLLTSITFCVVIPFVTIQLPAPSLPVLQPDYIIDNNWSTEIVERVSVHPPENNTSYSILAAVYFIIAILFFVRFAANIYFLLRKIFNNSTTRIDNATLVLLPEHITPHSFLHYVFVNKKDFETGAIEKEILLHELTHVRQNHTLDLLYAEILQSLLWFNPFFILYRKAIRLNHEFLADEAVIKIYNNRYSYQRLLIDKAANNNNSLFASRFNYYLITKKRLAMIARTHSKAISVIKKIAVLPLYALMLFFFSTNVIAQNETPSSPKSKDNTTKHKPYPKFQEPSWVRLSPGFTEAGVSEELINEYNAITEQHKPLFKIETVNNKKQIITSKFSNEERSRLEHIYKMMSKAQQAKAEIIFYKKPAPFAKGIPTEKTFNAWKNAAIYGVWIDGKKIKNEKLNQYKSSDFSHSFISKLYGAAKKNVSYNYQVDLMTNAYYDNYYKKAVSHNQPMMLARDPDTSYRFARLYNIP